MKNILLLVWMLTTGVTLLAQQQATVTVTMEQNGRVVRDTTYSFHDADKAEGMLRLMDIIATGKEPMAVKKAYHMEMQDDDKKVESVREIIIIDENGERKVIRHMGEEAFVWSSVDSLEGDEMEVIVKKFKDGEAPETGKPVKVIIKSKDKKSGEIEEKEIILEDEEVDEFSIDDDDEKAEIIIVKKKTKKKKTGGDCAKSGKPEK